MAVRIATYSRISGGGTQIRRGKDRFVESTSLDLQRDLTLEFALQHDGEIVHEFKDTGSGWKLTREEYQALLALARKGKLDAVLMYKLERFGRNNGEAITRCDELEREGVRIWSVIEGIDVAKFVRDIVFSVAAEESKSKRQYVLPMMRRMAELGLWPGRAPYGYRNDPDRSGHLIVYEPEARIAREMFERAAHGQSACSLSAWLDTLTDADGKRVLPPSWRNGPPKGHNGTRPYSDHWGMDTVCYILDNEVYAGWIVFDRRSNSVLVKRGLKASEHLIRVKGKHEPIVPQELWDRVHALRINRPHLFSHSAKRAREGRRFLLQGIVRCGICGRNMPGHFNHGQQLMKNGQRHVVYRCSHGQHGGMSGGKLNALVFKGLDDIVLPSNVLHQAVMLRAEKKSRPQPDRRAGLLHEKAELDKRRKKALYDLAGDAITRDEYAEVRAMVNDRLAQIEAELLTVNAVVPDQLDWQEIERMLLAMRTMRPLVESAAGSDDPTELDQAHAIVSSVIDHIVVTRGQEPTIVWKPWAERVRAAYAEMALGPDETYEMEVGTPEEMGSQGYAIRRAVDESVDQVAF